MRDRKKNRKRWALLFAASMVGFEDGLRVQREVPKLREGSLESAVAKKLWEMRKRGTLQGV